MYEKKHPWPRPRKPTRISTLVVFMLSVAACMAVVTGKVAYGDEWETSIEVGDTYPMYAACDARGANEVAKANLATGTNGAGNMEFNRQTVLRPPHCFIWGFPVPLMVEAVTYVGMNRGLHVLIIKFGDDIYAVMTGTHTTPPDPDPGPGLAGFSA